MHPVYDVDALLLLAIAISAKRRPATLVEIIAACDLIHGSVALKGELAEGFLRLSRHGLIVQAGTGYAPAPAALNMMSDGRKKAAHDERLLALKAALATCNTKTEHPALLVSEAQLSAAIHEHQLSKEHAGKNLLVPKPKAVVDSKRPQRRKPLPARRKF